ncbi:hypothetical protein D3C81_989170 [compost metagenome]
MKEFSWDLLDIGIGILILFVILLAGYGIFSLMTKFKDNEEIARGNEAAGMYMGSKMLGLCIIVAMVSFSSHSWISMVTWSAVGIVALCIVYVVFDLVTPKTKLGDEIAKGNMAVAQLLRGIVIGVSLVIGTFLM